ncbi:MAG: L-histidine N(alpha)-methyltransferase [Alphaproteobacteria bacterium]|nr:L-histidine N(alpha)-methyltransferase [Alphaproteobacteria bacterium]
MTPPHDAIAFVDLAPEPEDFLGAVLAGLGAKPKTLPCKYFYDARGARLFDAICALPEYYPTRTELSIIRTQAAAIADCVGSHATLIEFGSGSGQKTRALIDALDRPAAYVAIDISRTALLAAIRTLARERPGLEVMAICADYGAPIVLPGVQRNAAGPRVGVFLGSTIGNLLPEEAVGFLKTARNVLGPGGAMLVGADLRKERAVLEAAYNDSRGVTADFNMNLLRRINRELGANFELDGFAHHAPYDETLGRIEMHLVSQKAQDVMIARRRFHFESGETIHTENSHKYSVEGFQAMAREAGFAPRAVWFDRARLFSLHCLEVAD